MVVIHSARECGRAAEKYILVRYIFGIYRYIGMYRCTDPENQYILQVCTENVLRYISSVHFVIVSLLCLFEGLFLFESPSLSTAWVFYTEYYVSEAIFCWFCPIVSCRHHNTSMVLTITSIQHILILLLHSFFILSPVRCGGEYHVFLSKRSEKLVSYQ